MVGSDRPPRSVPTVVGSPPNNNADNDAARGRCPGTRRAGPPGSAPQRGTDLWKALGQLGAAVDIHPEVHRLLGLQPGVQRVDQRDQFGSLGLDRQQLQQILVRAAVALIGSCGSVAPDASSSPWVSRSCVVVTRCSASCPTPQHQIGDRRWGPARLQLARIPADHLECQLPQLGWAQQPGCPVRRTATEAVLAQQSARERVIRADGRRFVDGAPAASRPVPPAGPTGTAPGAAAAQRPCG